MLGCPGESAGLLPRNSQPATGKGWRSRAPVPWGLGMHCPCLLSACCMLGPDAMSAVMGTRKGGPGEKRGVGDLLVSGKLFLANSILRGGGLVQGVGNHGLGQLLECSGRGAASQVPWESCPPEVPSPTQAPPQPPGAEVSRAPGPASSGLPSPQLSGESN